MAVSVKNEIDEYLKLDEHLTELREKRPRLKANSAHDLRKMRDAIDNRIADDEREMASLADLIMQQTHILIVGNKELRLLMQLHNGVIGHLLIALPAGGVPDTVRDFIRDNGFVLD